MKKDTIFVLWKMTNVDLFALFNSLLFFLMLVFVYYDRFVSYRGAANITEFLFYATVIYAVIVFFWMRLRLVSIPTYVFVLFEFMILLHFSAAFIQVNGHRLYDYRLGAIRFDKVVHFLNASAGTFIAAYFFRKHECRQSKFITMMIVFVVLGAGATIEIAEYVVTLTVKYNGVGAYNNNMLDLVANFFGAVSTATLYYYYKKNEK